MAPCSPNDISIDLPSGPSGLPLPGFGVPFSLKLPNINPFPDGFPEDLLDILNKLQMLIPPGTLLSQLNPNFGKDIFDGIMKLLDQFMPYLMMYKFFLPLLRMILCIIEVLCALKNPYKVRRAIKRLFRKCIPEFLNLFPSWALIIMIISLLLLLLALIEYIYEQIIKFIQRILRNIIALRQAFEDADDNAILAIAQKLGALLCIFQNLFVLLALINIVFSIFRDILSLAFPIPPCSDSDGSDDGCCTADVCPAIIKNGDYERVTGTLQYYNAINIPVVAGFYDADYREESWQLYDIQQEEQEAFSNIIDAYDVTTSPKPVFFPTDSTYTAGTPATQAAYTFDLKMFYNPSAFGRNTPEDGEPRWIQFRDCIMLESPKKYKYDYQNSTSSIPTGVSKISGGLGYEDDGSILYAYADGLPNEEILTGNDLQTTLGSNTVYAADITSHIVAGDLIIIEGSSFDSNGYTILSVNTVANSLVLDTVMPVTLSNIEFTIYHVYKPIKLTTQATLNSFINMASVSTINPNPKPSDGYVFTDVEYIFKPNFETLFSKDIITVGCFPEVSLEKEFINGAIAGDFGAKLAELNAAMLVENGFPDPDAAQECLTTAVAGLRGNLTVAGVAQFQTTALACLAKLQDDANTSLGKMVELGFDACSSEFSLEPQRQFTSQPIQITVDLKERNGHDVASGLSAIVASNLADKIKAYATFGEVSRFVYDGYTSFNADITSDIPGSGKLMISFDDNIFCTNTLPDSIDEDPSHTLNTLDYRFVYTPTVAGGGVPTTEGDSTGKPRRTETDGAVSGHNSGSGK